MLAVTNVECIGRIIPTLHRQDAATRRLQK